MRSWSWIAMAWLALLGACQDRASPSPSAAGGQGGTAGTATGGSIGPPTSFSCEGADCPACARGALCAPEGEELDGGTCCAHGDALVHLGSERASEAVDVISDGDLAVLCGGFGASVLDVTDAEAPRFLGSVSPRCQRAAFAAKAADQPFFIAHHGDSWVPSPHLQTWRRSGDMLVEVDSLTEPGVLYEGLAWHDDRLFVAAHDQGLRIYDTAAGAPSYVASVAGMSNAWTVALSEDGMAFVADFDRGLHVVDVSVATPVIVNTVETIGPPRNLSIHGDRIYVAEGGFGVEVFERGATGDVTRVGHIEVEGTAQSVSAGDEVIAVAAWSHVAVYETESLRLMATEKLARYPSFEQDLGVALVDDQIYVAEWEKLHILRARPGYIGADIWIAEKLFQFPSDAPSTRAVVVRNRGDLPLELSAMRADDGAFTVSTDRLSVPAGEGDFFEVSVSPPATSARLRMETNDLDPVDESWVAGLLTSDGTRLGVGDTIDATFSFLDPSGNNMLSGLNGHVVVLAYFALF